ncbi:MAG: iron-sulfur cluster assembly scaffold protein [Sphingopyxis sp.]
MSRPLYTPEILRLAVNVADFPRLAHPDASEEGRTPICGSRIVVDICVDASGQVLGVGMDVHACAMGQAAAALFARGACGRTADELEGAQLALADWLSGKAETPPDWPGIAVLSPAIAHSVRHAAILMPFRAGSGATKRAFSMGRGRAA